MTDQLCEYFVLLAIGLVLAVVLFVDFLLVDRKCDIPVREWVIILVLLWLFWRTLALSQICVLRHCDSFKTYSSTFVFVAGSSMVAGWLVVGLIWFYSQQNDCADQETTLGYYWLMQVLVLLGSFFLLVYVVALVVVPCAYVQQFAHSKPNKTCLYTLLSRSHLNPRQFMFESNCVLCSRPFAPNDAVS